MSHDAHGSHGAHGHGAPAQDHGHAPAHVGPVELPPVPVRREITPAPEDFATRPSFLALLWPLVWVGLFFGLWSSVRGTGWKDAHALGHGSEHAPTPHR